MAFILATHDMFRIGEYINEQCRLSIGSSLEKFTVHVCSR